MTNQIAGIGIDQRGLLDAGEMKDIAQEIHDYKQKHMNRNRTGKRQQEIIRSLRCETDLKGIQDRARTDDINNQNGQYFGVRRFQKTSPDKKISAQHDQEQLNDLFSKQ